MRPRIKLIDDQLNDQAATAISPVRALATDIVTWDELVGENSTIELEIGSGKGLFLQAAALANPSHRFVGIELAAKFADQAAQRISRSGITNVSMLRGDAEAFITHKVPTASLAHVHVYFPDPWWRRKHKKRRVLNDDSLREIERILQLGGQLHFWTDVLDYYDLICGHLIDHSKLAGPEFVPERTPQHDMDYTTHFERRARRNGQPIYRALFTKINLPTDSPHR